MFSVAGHQFEDLEEFRAEIFKVASKEGPLIPYRLNATQQYLEEEITKRRASRVVITKYRQGGVSEYWLKRFVEGMLLDFPKHTAIVSHEAEATQRLLDRVRTTYNNLPSWFKPAIHHNSANEMSWPEIGSSIYVGTAGQRSFGRGDTFHYILMSEYAHWEASQAAKIRLGLQESCPATGIIVAECSPNGEGNEHHQLYLAAKAGDSPYKAIFLPWMLNKAEYSYDAQHPLTLERDRGELELTTAEVLLSRNWNLTEDNIRWRRSKVTEIGRKPGVPHLKAEDYFKQEYPEDDVSCFLSLNLSVFNSEVVLNMLGGVKPPIRVDEMGTEWWGYPLPGRTFIVACDPTGGWGEDEGVILGLDVTDYPQIHHLCTWHGRVRDDQMGVYCTEIAKRLSKAKLIIEANDVGQSVLNTVIRTLHYSNVYYQADPLTNYPQGRPGFVTTGPSKRMLVTEGLRVIDGGYLHTADENLIKQLQYFRRADDGTFSGAPGVHDDYAMAVLLGIFAASGKKGNKSKSRAYGWSWA